MRLQAPWINDLADGLLIKDIKTVHQVHHGIARKNWKAMMNPKRNPQSGLPPGRINRS